MDLSWLPMLLAALAADSAPADVAAGELKGTVGVCVRWAADPHHVAEAIVVVPSGNKRLDEAIPRSVEAMKWDRPTGKYRGGWIGINMAVGEPGTDRPLPSCTHLPPPPATDGAPWDSA